jgi:cell division protein FtsL
MGEVQHRFDPRLEEQIRGHEARARELEQQIDYLSRQPTGEEVNQRIRALHEQVAAEQQEIARLRQMAIQMMSSGGSQVT